MGGASAGGIGSIFTLRTQGIGIHFGGGGGRGGASDLVLGCSIRFLRNLNREFVGILNFLLYSDIII